MILELEILSPSDDLPSLVEQINIAQWDEENDIYEYTIDSLKSYLQRQDTIFIVCYRVDGSVSTLAGMASARIEPKPYGVYDWLYIDEVDTCSNHRQQGVGTALMRKFLEIARENNCEEVWLGAESINIVANKFYESLQPDAIDEVIGYTFETD